MGMSTHCVAIRPPDEKWKKMKDAWDACEVAGVEPPEDVVDFFEGARPDPIGVHVASVSEDTSKMPSWVKHFKADMEEGFEIDVTKLPKDVTVVRVYNSY